MNSYDDTHPIYSTYMLGCWGRAHKENCNQTPHICFVCTIHFTYNMCTINIITVGTASFGNIIINFPEYKCIIMCDTC